MIRNFGLREVLFSFNNLMMLFHCLQACIVSDEKWVISSYCLCNISFFFLPLEAFQIFSLCLILSILMMYLFCLGFAKLPESTNLCLSRNLGFFSVNVSPNIFPSSLSFQNSSYKAHFGIAPQFPKVLLVFEKKKPFYLFFMLKNFFDQSQIH